MTNYIKTAFTNPKEIYTGRNMKNSHFFSLFFSLVMVLTLFSLLEFYPSFREMSQDITETKQAIPEFTLEDNELQSASESFIYQTDTLFLYFDPNDQLTTETINRNMNTVPVPVAIGLLNEELSLNILGQSFSVRYADLTNFTTEDLKALIENFGEFSPGYLFLFILFLLIATFLSYLTQFFPIVLFANILSVYRRTGLRFVQTVKVAFLATIPPVLILYAVNAFLFPVYYQLEILIVSSIIIYYLSLSEMKSRMKNQHQSDE